MEIVYLLVGIAIGAAIMGLLQKLKEQGKKAQELHQTQVEQEQAATQKKTREDELSGLLFEEKERRIRAEEKLRATLENAEEKEKHLLSTFRDMAARAMETNNNTFLNLANQTLEKHIAKADASMNQKSDALTNLLAPLQEAMTKQKVAVKDLEANSNKTFGSLLNYLDQLQQSHLLLQKETGALVNALKSPKVRGRWGEIGLKRIVEFSGLSSYCDFSEQVSVEGEDGRLRPDMVVNLPGGKKIVVDSKVPLNAYLESLETADEAQQKLLLERHAKAIAGHAKDLGSKAYWAEFDDSVDFVVLYMEVESAFGAALMVNNNLITEALGNRVVFATPTTLITLLQTVAFSWKQHGATENAQEIWKSAVEMYERLAVFSDHFKKLGGTLNTSVKTFNQAVGSWDTRVMPGMRKLEDLKVSSEKKKLSDIEPVESIPRGINE